MYFNYNQCYINVFQMNGWISGLTVYNVHVMFEISAKTIRNKMQTKLAMFEYLKLQAFIMHFCMIRLRKYIRTLVITRYIITCILIIINAILMSFR
jgi:hypothetical protein